MREKVEAALAKVRPMLQADGGTRTLVRELNSAKGTCSQNAPELHFGIGKDTVTDIQRISYDQDQN